MSPVAFPEVNCVMGKGQMEYDPLPVHRSPEAIVVSCWKLTWWERVKALWTGRVWVRQLTFGDPLQPQLLSIEKPFAPAPEATRQAA